MQCPSCGSDVPRGAAHCPSCGAKISDSLSSYGISSDDEPTTASSPYRSVQHPPIATNYGSDPYDFPANPYEQNPYGSAFSSPPPPPRPSGIKREGVIALLVFGLILASGIGVFAWHVQSTATNAQKITAHNTTPASEVARATETTSTAAAGHFDTSFYYRLTNSLLGPDHSLAVKSDGSHHLQMAQTSKDKGQMWKLVDLGGTYALRAAYLGDSYSLDIINDGTNNTPWMATTGNYTGQSWTFVTWGDGTYKLTNDFTGPEKALDTYSDTHDPFLETGDHSGQHWTLSPLTKISG